MASVGDSNGPDSIPQRRSEVPASRGRMLPPVPRAPTDGHLSSTFLDPQSLTNLTVVVPDVRDQSPPLQPGAFRSQVSPNGRSSRSTLVSQRSRTDSAGASPTSTRSSVGSPTDGSPSRPRASSSAASASTSYAAPRSGGAAATDAAESQREDFSILTNRFLQGSSSSPAANARTGAVPPVSSRERTGGSMATSSVRANSTTSVRTSASSSSARAGSVVSSGRTSAVTSSVRAGAGSSIARTSGSNSSVRASSASQPVGRASNASAGSVSARQNLSASAARTTSSSSSVTGGKLRSTPVSERVDPKNTLPSRGGVGRASSSSGGGGTRLMSGKEDIGKSKLSTKSLSTKATGNPPLLEPDQIAVPPIDKVKILEEENEDLRRKLVAMEATQAAMAENPTAFEHWKLNVLRSQNTQLEDQLLAATTSLQDFGDLKAQLGARAAELQQMVGRLKTFEQLPDPKLASAPAAPSPPRPTSSLRRTLSAATSAPDVPSSSARRLSAPSRSTPSSPSLRSTSPASSTSRLSSGSPRPASPSGRTPATSSRNAVGSSSKSEPRPTRSSPAPSRASLASRSTASGNTGRGGLPAASRTPASGSGEQETRALPSEPASSSDVPQPVKLIVPQEWVSSIEGLAQEMLSKLTRSAVQAAEPAEERKVPAGGSQPAGDEKKGSFRVVFFPSSQNPYVVRSTEQGAIHSLASGDNDSRMHQEDSMLDFVRLRLLEAQLGSLHPRLLRLTELLRSLLLPCLPTETMSALEREVREAEESLNDASEALAQLAALIPFLSGMGGRGPSISRQIRGALTRPVDAGYDSENRNIGSEMEGIPVAEPAGNGNVSKNSKLLEAKQGEFESLESMIRNFLQVKEGVMENDEEHLRGLLQHIRKMDLSWRSQMRALEDEIAFYRGCHAVNAAHVERVTQLAKAALEAVLEDAAKIIASSATSVQQVLAALHRSHSEASDEADRAALLQLQAAAPSLRLFVEMLPESLKELPEDSSSSAHPPVAQTVQSKASAAMSSLERAYKDRLQAVFESLQVKRGEAYRQRSIAGSLSSASPAALELGLGSGVEGNNSNGPSEALK